MFVDKLNAKKSVSCFRIETYLSNIYRGLGPSNVWTGDNTLGCVRFWLLSWIWFRILCITKLEDFNN